EALSATAGWRCNSLGGKPSQPMRFHRYASCRRMGTHRVDDTSHLVCLSTNLHLWYVETPSEMLQSSFLKPCEEGKSCERHRGCFELALLSVAESMAQRGRERCLQ